MTAPDDARRRELRRSGLFLVLILAIGGIGVYLLLPLAGNGGDGRRVIDVAIDMAGFDTPVIRVPVGQPVTIRVTSLDRPYYLEDGGRHQLAVDELGLDIIAPPLGTDSATFTPTEPGTYEFYCDICCGGRANPSMVGTLIVEGP